MDTTALDPMSPRTVTEMVGAETWTRFGELLATNQHVILTGCAGCGKSRATRLLLGATDQIALWFRCSTDPSLRDNRDRIKDAARKCRGGGGGGCSFIVLEHADLLHADAQAFLRRVIETATKSTRFLLEVRDLGAITEPILSRMVLFNVPAFLDYEIRAEIQRRVPSVEPAVANRLALQSGGNIRWAVLQALGGGDGFLDASIVASAASPLRSWADLLAVMEQLQSTGSSPRAYLGDQVSPDVWDRPGGACPWSILAATLSEDLE